MSTMNNLSELLANLQQHAGKVNDVKDFCTDEAKTRSYLVEPLLDTLGYDCRDPRDVVYEFTADVADKKGEKVDYALMRDGRPVVLVEAKTRGNRLGGNEREQLQRYFPFTLARLAVLTDGIRWHWYKGRSERDQSHQMESSPFLIYDARKPTETAAEWLTQVTKDGFNPDELLRISRRNEFTDRISDWIDRTLVNPSDTAAVELRKVVGLEASSRETPLVLDAIRSAWARVMGKQIDGRGRATIPDEVGDSTDQSVNAPDIHQSLPTDAQSPSAEPSEDSLTLQFASHWDEHIELGNGEVLDANRRPRAWRKGNQDWIKKRNGTEVTLAALGELLRCDRRHEDEQSIAEVLGLHYSDTKPNNRKLRPIPGFSNIYWNMDLNNYWKAMLLEQIASDLQFDPPLDSPLADMPRIEWWLPEKPKR